MCPVAHTFLMSETEPSWDHYAALLAVLDAGSLSGASRALGLTQPTVRRQVEAQPILLQGGLRLRVVISSLPRDEARYIPRDESQVHTLFIHHTGMPAHTTLEELAQLHRAEWPGLLFDFVIDGRGAVFQTQPLDRAPDTDADHLVRAVNIAFAGDYGAGGAPTPGP